jgi:hypothetical protein
LWWLLVKTMPTKAHSLTQRNPNPPTPCDRVVGLHHTKPSACWNIKWRISNQGGAAPACTARGCCSEERPDAVPQLLCAPGSWSQPERSRPCRAALNTPTEIPDRYFDRYSASKYAWAPIAPCLATSIERAHSFSDPVLHPPASAGTRSQDSCLPPARRPSSPLETPIAGPGRCRAPP